MKGARLFVEHLLNEILGLGITHGRLVEPFQLLEVELPHQNTNRLGQALKGALHC
jgi:hypothetical protein